MRQVFLVFLFCFSVMLSPVFAADDIAPEIEQQYELGGQAFDNKDYEKAYEIWLPLAEDGHSKAQNGIGLLYGSDGFLLRDEAKEIEWYLKAAQQNNSQAQMNLALSNNGEEAAFWLYVAAYNGHEDALKAYELLKTQAAAFELTKNKREEARNWLLSIGGIPRFLD